MMRIKFFLIICLFSLTACSYFPWVHRIDVQQGNVVTQDMVNQLKPGMTKEQVRFLLGTPVLIDTFNNNRWHYVYTVYKGQKKLEEHELVVLFKNDRLQSLSGDTVPQH